jgi:hypothetical protein
VLPKERELLARELRSVMADTDHAAAFAQMKAALARVERRDVTGAFVASLRTKHWIAHSTLAAWAVARVMPDHEPFPSRFSGGTMCATCWAPFGGTVNVTSHRERIAKGPGIGIAHYYLSPVYVAATLEAFADSVVPRPTPVDFATFGRILSTIRAHREGNLSTLEKTLGKAFRSNKWERKGLLDLLGILGILQTPAHRGFFDAFPTGDVREERRRQGKHDWEYPVQWWVPSDGIDQRALAFWFGDDDLTP